jgi:Arc/MetJ family transcription regulator
MRRATIELDEALLDEAARYATDRTTSGIVNEALAEYCRQRRTADILQFRGSGIWEGDLDVMRTTYAPRPDPSSAAGALKKPRRAKQQDSRKRRPD